MRRLLAVAVALAFAAPAAAQPNVVFIVTDDQRWDTVGVMPTVAGELAAKGATFENAFAVNPVCCPSRASILTGQWSHSTGVWSNVVRTDEHGGFPAFDDSETLPLWLQRAGYRTMLAGKYLNGYWPDFTEPTYVPPGWESWLAFWGRGNPYFDYEVTDGAAVTAFGSADEDYSTDVLARAAVDFVRDPDPRPFFLLLAPAAPHWTGDRGTVTPAPRHAGAFAGTPPHEGPAVNEADVSDKPRYIRRRPLLDMEQIGIFRELQLESLLAVDEAVAGILAALDETGKLADTLLIFTSDNGYEWGEHRWAQKTAPHEESLRVPLVMRWDAGDLVAGVRVGEPVLNVDLASTIARAADADSPGARGRDALPLARGQAVRWRSRFLFEQYGGTVPAYCGFRGSRWKYVQYATGEEELYDLRRDPFELENVARDRRTLVMGYRADVRRSACRPPGFRPLTLCSKTGTRRADRIWGTRRRDWICAGAGRDVIRVRSGGRDVVKCGRGRDTVYAGRSDIVRGCERVIRRG